MEPIKDTVLKSPICMKTNASIYSLSFGRCPQQQVVIPFPLINSQQYIRLWLADQRRGRQTICIHGV